MNTTMDNIELRLLPEGAVKDIATFLGYKVDFVRKVLKGQRNNQYILTAAYTLAAKKHKIKEGLDEIKKAVIADTPISITSNANIIDLPAEAN